MIGVNDLTSTFTILCPEGIVMATDSRIKVRGKLFNGIQKIYQMLKTPIGISYWGYVGFNGKIVLEHLKDFEKDYVTDGDTVDHVAEKLKEYLENINPKISDRGGFHLAGCIQQNQSYRLRHVFHETWHNVGEFTNENCHVEFHDPHGNKIIPHDEKSYPVLFNGDNFVANALFNYAPFVDGGFMIRPELLSLQEAIDLSNLILNWAVRRLTFYFGPNQRKVLPTTGGQIFVAKITCQNGFEWIQPTQEKEKRVWIPEEPTEIGKEFFQTIPQPQEEIESIPRIRPSSNIYYASVDIFPLSAPDTREMRVVGLTCYLPPNPLILLF